MHQGRFEFSKTVGGLNSHKIFDPVRDQDLAKYQIDVKKDIISNGVDEIISPDNLFLAWKEFRRGKRSRLDVQEFEFNLEDNLFQLHKELKTKTYQHFNYTRFYIQDPKLRLINKATVKDRVLHHAIFRKLYPIFDKSFIHDSYSCRINKGTHRAVKRLEKFSKKLSKNNKHNFFCLKCDIRKFFDSIDQGVLLNLIKNKIKDKNAFWLIEKIVRSFLFGLPLGNVTSQLFANIYLNELDQFIKRELKERYYLRYCDDFIILSQNEKSLTKLILPISKFLKNHLNLTLHPNKIILRKYKQGIDFLGYVARPHYRVLRTRTKNRMLKKVSKKRRDFENGLISKTSFNQSLQSYLGILKHCRGWGIKQELI